MNKEIQEKESKKMNDGGEWRNVRRKQKKSKCRKKEKKQKSRKKEKK